MFCQRIKFCTAYRNISMWHGILNNFVLKKYTILSVPAWVKINNECFCWIKKIAQTSRVKYKPLKTTLQLKSKNVSVKRCKFLVELKITVLNPLFFFYSLDLLRNVLADSKFTLQLLNSLFKLFILPITCIFYSWFLITPFIFHFLNVAWPFRWMPLGIAALHHFCYPQLARYALAYAMGAHDSSSIKRLQWRRLVALFWSPRDCVTIAFSEEMIHTGSWTS